MTTSILGWIRERADRFAEVPEELRLLRDNLHQLTGVAALDFEAAGIRVRKIIEGLVRTVHSADLCDPRKKPLFEMIESLREKGVLPPRIASYLHTIRRIGDDAAHHEILEEDLLAILLPLLLVVEWYFCSYAKGPGLATVYVPGPAEELPPPLHSASAVVEHAELVERLLGLVQRVPAAFRLRLWVEADEPSRPVRDFLPDFGQPLPRLLLGDRAAICACADRDCFLWIVDVGTTGRSTIIFPRGTAEDNRVVAGQVVRIAGTLAGKAGLETVHAFASTQPLAGTCPAASSPPRASERRVRDFLVAQDMAVSQIKVAQSSATIQFPIRPARESTSETPFANT